jgi:small basic protein
MVNFIIDFDMLRLSIGLVGLIGANILLGSVDAFLQGQFDKRVFRNGAIKGAVVAISFVLVYFVGVLNPDITLEVSGQQMTLLMMVNAILLVGFGKYAIEVVSKLKDMILSKLSKPEEHEKLLGTGEIPRLIEYVEE